MATRDQQLISAFTTSSNRRAEDGSPEEKITVGDQEQGADGNCNAFEEFVAEIVAGTPKNEQKDRVSSLIPLVFVKAKVYAVTEIDAVKRTGKCTVDVIIMLDWFDPSLAKAMEHHDKMPADYDIQSNGHFVPMYTIHNAVEKQETGEPPRLGKHGWKRGHAKMTSRYDLALERRQSDLPPG